MVFEWTRFSDIVQTQFGHTRTAAICTQTLHLKYKVPKFHAALRILKTERVVNAIRLGPDNEGI